MFDKSFLVSNNLYGLEESLKQIHFPDSLEQLNKSINRLKFDEHFLFQIIMAMNKKKIKSNRTKSLKDIGKHSTN